MKLSFYVPAKRHWNNNLSDTSGKPLKNREIAGDSFTLRFKGEEGESSVPAPSVFQQLEVLMETSLDRVKQANGPDVQIQEVASYHRAFEGLLDEWLSSLNNEGNRLEWFKEDLRHELSNFKSHFFFRRIRPYQRGKITDLGEDFGEAFLQCMKGMKSTWARFQSFYDKGLESSSNGVDSIFELAMDPIRNGAKEKNIHLELSGENLLANQKTITKIKDYHLYTVFTNLLQNAVKYTPAGGTINIGMQLTPGDPTQGTEERGLLFAIEDSGIGIPPGEHEDVLDGERGSNAVASGIEGTGYGLARVSKLLDFAGGSLVIESPIHNDTENPGTRITCLIPLLPRNAE